MILQVGDRCGRTGVGEMGVTYGWTVSLLGTGIYWASTGPEQAGATWSVGWGDEKQVEKSGLCTWGEAELPVRQDEHRGRTWG